MDKDLMRTDIFNTPLTRAKEILANAKILGAAVKMSDIELQHYGAAEEARRHLLYMFGRAFGDELKDVQIDMKFIDVIDVNKLPYDMLTEFRAELVVLTKTEYNELTRAVLSMIREKELFVKPHMDSLVK